MNTNNNQNPTVINISNTSNEPKVSKYKFFLKIYAVIITLIFLCDLLFYTYLVPNYLKIDLDLVNTVSLIYNKTHFITVEYLYNYAFAFGILILRMVDFILKKAINFAISDPSTKNTTKRLKNNIMAFIFTSLIYSAIGNNRYCTAIILGIPILIIIDICYSDISIISKILRIILLIAINNAILDIFAPPNIYSRSTLLYKMPGIDLEKFEAFFNKYKFNIENVYVLKTKEFVNACNLYDEIFVCENLINPKYFDIFKAVFLHELGHYRNDHSVIMSSVSILISVIMLIGIGRYYKNQENREYKRYLDSLCVIFIITELIKYFMNGFSQVFEFQADQYSIKNEPSLTNYLKLGLLMRSDAVVVKEVNKINDRNFIYPIYHPFYSHPCVYDRISKMN